MKKENSIEEFLQSDDPLSDSALEFAINYKEEDIQLDYKLTLDIKSEKGWLELTKDISAFANTLGGYLVFGVKNETKQAEGIEEELGKVLSDANNIQQKINRFLDPDINNIRSKLYEFDGNNIVIVYIPQSATETHIISKDGSFTFESGKSKILLQKGTFYVRKSAGNHLGDARDLSQIIDRRINHYRENLLSRIARVVEAPPENEVFVLAKDPEDKENKRFIIQDGPDSIPIKGMSFSVAPEGLEEEIAAWAVISSGNPRIVPPTESLWHWYKVRKELQIPANQRLTLAQFSMFSDAPIFFWLQDLGIEEIKKTILYSLKHRPPSCQLRPFFMVASFLGKGFYNKALGILGEQKKKLPTTMMSYPKLDPKKAFCRCEPSGNKSNETHLGELEKELNQIVDSVDGKKLFQPSTMQRFRALQVDCYLYALNGKYKESVKGNEKIDKPPLTKTELGSP